MNIKDYEVVKKLHGGNQSKSYLLKNGNVLKIHRVLSQEALVEI